MTYHLIGEDCLSDDYKKLTFAWTHTNPHGAAIIPIDENTTIEKAKYLFFESEKTAIWDEVFEWIKLNREWFINEPILEYSGVEVEYIHGKTMLMVAPKAYTCLLKRNSVVR